MDIAENLIKIKAIVRELEQLVSNASPIDKSALFEPYTRLYANAGQGVIEADRLGNAPPPSAVDLVEKWFHDVHWESDLWTH